MSYKHVFLVGIGLALGLGFRSSEQAGGQKPQTVQDFPDLVAGLKGTPGVLDVKTSAFHDGKQLAIFAWFKNKAAVQAWYMSPMHRDAMRKFFPKMPGKPTSLAGFRDEKAPLLVVATVTPSKEPKFEGSDLAISQIAIEIYTPVPGGLTLGGGFGPKNLAVPGLTRMGDEVAG